MQRLIFTIEQVIIINHLLKKIKKKKKTSEKEHRLTQTRAQATASHLFTAFDLRWYFSKYC